MNLIRASPVSLKFPSFDGDDPEGWLFKAEQYYTLHGVNEAKKVPLASVHLTGDAISWYRWLNEALGELSWQQFSRLLRSRFGARRNIDPCSTLSKLAQKGNVREFITEFEKLLNLCVVYLRNI